MRALLALALLAPGAAAQGADLVPLPDKVFFVGRIASLDRLDQAFKDLPNLSKLIVKPGQKLSDSVFDETGIAKARVKVDRARPLYFAMGEDELALVPVAPEVAWEGLHPWPGGRVAALRNGYAVIGKRSAVARPARPRNLDMLPGDVSLQLSFAALVDEGGAGLRESMRRARQELPFEPGSFAHRLVRSVMAMGQEAILGLRSFDYALTHRYGGFFSDARVRAKKGSVLQAFYTRAPKPGDVALGAFLPEKALVIIDSFDGATWFSRELTRVLERDLGEGKGKALLTLGGPASIWTEHLTGRSAIAFSMSAMMSVTTFGVWEIKEGVDLKAKVAAFDPGPFNTLLRDADVPLRMEYRAGAAKHGDTELHRITYRSGNPLLAPFVMQAGGYLAVQGRYLLYAQSASALSDIKDQIDRVRVGPREGHAHLAAMRRLGRTRHFGISINLGGLRQLVALLALLEPQAATVAQMIPERLYTSTAVRFEGGEILWTGEWPLEEIDRIAGLMKGR